jgi:hypothetical protein
MVESGEDAIMAVWIDTGAAEACECLKTWWKNDLLE